MARILLVDDNEVDRVFEAALLEQAGHEVVFAPHGQAALNLFRKQSFDLVVTDLAMPELNGLRLIRELRELDEAVRIVAVSGVDADQLDLAEDFGAARTVFKPLDPPLFLEAVDAALTRVTFSQGRWR